MGGDARHLRGDGGRPRPPDRRAAFGRLWIDPYRRWAPGWVYAARAEGRVVGYLTGCPATASFLLSAGLLGPRPSLGANLRFPKLFLAGLLARHPAHLHVNVREGHRGGTGRALMERFERDLTAASVPGVHVFCGERPLGFHRAIGYQVLASLAAGPKMVFALGKTLSRQGPARAVMGAPVPALNKVDNPVRNVANCTVLFCDMRGFTALASRLAPAEGFSYIQDYLDGLEPAISEAGGSLNNWTGDGFLAEFGASRALADHAARAVNAAIAIRRRLMEFNRGRHLAHARVASVGVGIHSGPLAAGSLRIGRLTVDAIVGDTVNVAARLQALTREFGVDVLVSEAAARLLPMGAPVMAMPLRRVRGKDEPMAAYWLKPGARPIRAGGEGCSTTTNS